MIPFGFVFLVCFQTQILLVSAMPCLKFVHAGLAKIGIKVESYRVSAGLPHDGEFVKNSLKNRK